jgi:hypothetical protein
VFTAALIFVLGLLFMVDLTVSEARRRRYGQPAVPVPPAQPKLFDQDAEEG